MVESIGIFEFIVYNVRNLTQHVYRFVPELRLLFTFLLLHRHIYRVT